MLIPMVQRDVKNQLPHKFKPLAPYSVRPDDPDTTSYLESRCPAVDVDGWHLVCG